MADYLTLEEVSTILNVKKRTVQTYIKQGKLPAIRLSKKTIRIPKRELFETLFNASLRYRS